MLLAYTDGEISDYCKAIGDDNCIHNPEFMRKRGMHTIVPGTLTLAGALSTATFDSYKEAKIHASFGTPVHSEEMVNSICEEGRIRVMKGEEEKGEEDALSSVSTITFGEDPINSPRIGFPVCYEPDNERFKRFKEITELKGHTDTLYAINLSSRALLESIASGLNKHTERLQLKRDRGILPVLLDLTISVINPIELNGGPLNYVVACSQNSQNKNIYQFEISCDYKGKRVANCSANVRAMTEKFIMEHYAKSLVN